jgi:very-short-patch-repair endonuclease
MTRNARNLRNNATLPEHKLWQLLSNHRPKFTRQLVIGPYIADLANRTAKLVVEIDGEQHLDNPLDEMRTGYLQRGGWTVIRFWNHEVLESPEAVAERVLTRTAECLGGTHPNPSLPGRGAKECRDHVSQNPDHCVKKRAGSHLLSMIPPLF